MNLKKAHDDNKPTLLDIPHEYEVDENGVTTLNIVIRVGDKRVIFSPEQAKRMRPIMNDRR